MSHVNGERRQVLASGGLFAALVSLGLLPSRAALAEWNKAAFEGKNIPDTLKALGLETPTASGELQLIASDIAENGAVVPIQIVSRIANTTRLALMVEKNPNMLAATFDILPEAIADVTTRVKMGQTSNVVALAVAGGKVFSATKEIKVTLGGCGG